MFGRQSVKPEPIAVFLGDVVKNYLLSLNRVQGDGGAVSGETVPHISNPNTLTVEGQRRGEAK